MKIHPRSLLAASVALVASVASVAPVASVAWGQDAGRDAAADSARVLEAWQAYGPGGAAPRAYDLSAVGRTLLGTGAGALHARRLGGARWRSVAGAPAVGDVAELAARPFSDGASDAAWLAASDAGVWRSLDAGVTWESVLALPLSGGGLVAFSDVVWDASQPDVAWAAVGDFRASREAGPGGDVAFEHAHVWRSDARGAAGSWQPLPGPLDLAGVHSLVPSPLEGGEALYASSTLGVWVARRAGGAGSWTWSDIAGQGVDSLPHGDARDLVLDSATGTLYVALASHWDTSQPTAHSIYDYDRGYGGGVWFSQDEGASWFPTARPDWTDGLFLEEGFHLAGVGYPKNVRRLAFDQARGEILLGLTWGAPWNEGVWRGRPYSGGVLWERMTETQGAFANVAPDGGGELGAIDLLWIDQASGDVVLGTARGAWRCPGGGCRVADAGAPDWVALHGSGHSGDPLAGLSVHDADLFGGAQGLRFLATSERGLLRSGDGLTWTRAGGPAVLLPPDLPAACRALAVSPSGTGSFGLFESSTGAELWTTGGLPHPASAWTSADLGKLEQPELLAFDFVDDDSAWLAASGALLRGTRQAGSSWAFEPAEQGLEQTEIAPTALACTAHSGGAALVALDGQGIFRRGALESTWSATRPPAGAPPEQTRVVALAWSRAEPARAYALVELERGVARETAVLRSDDGGRRWERASADFAGFRSFDLAPIDLDLGLDQAGAERLWIATATADGALTRVLHSGDGGATWTAHEAAPPDLRASFLHVEPYAGGGLVLGSQGYGARRWSPR